MVRPRIFFFPPLFDACVSETEMVLRMNEPTGGCRLHARDLVHARRVQIFQHRRSRIMHIARRHGSMCITLRHPASAHDDAEPRWVDGRNASAVFSAKGGIPELRGSRRTQDGRWYLRTRSIAASGWARARRARGGPPGSRSR